MPSLWEALVTAILAQQVNLLFAYDIRRELAETFGRRARFGGVTYFAFPRPNAFSAETVRRMRRFRLSDNKAKAILGLAEAFDRGALDESDLETHDDEGAIGKLTEFHGVGRWTAEIGLLRGLGRPDIFPAGDLGVVKYLAQGLLGRREKAKEEAMRRFAARWRPFRSLALVYGYAELNRRKGERPAGPPPRPRRPRAPETGSPREELTIARAARIANTGMSDPSIAVAKHRRRDRARAAVLARREKPSRRLRRGSEPPVEAHGEQAAERADADRSADRSEERDEARRDAPLPLVHDVPGSPRTCDMDEGPRPMPTSAHAAEIQGDGGVRGTAAATRPTSPAKIRIAPRRAVFRKP